MASEETTSGEQKNDDTTLIIKVFIYWLNELPKVKGISKITSSLSKLTIFHLCVFKELVVPRNWRLKIGLISLFSVSIFIVNVFLWRNVWGIKTKEDEKFESTCRI